jgi:hypothetical protein
MGSERFMDTQHPHTLSHSYEELEVAAAGAHNVTISGRNAMLLSLRLSASLCKEPKVEVALV